MTEPKYAFLGRMGRILNSGQTRSLLLTGNVHDLFYHPGRDDYLPLLEFLIAHWDLPGRIVVVYEVNGPIRFLHAEQMPAVREAWVRWRTGKDPDTLAVERMLAGVKAPAVHAAVEAAFDANLANAVGRPAAALEFLRQLCACARNPGETGPLLADRLIIVIEAADLLLPEAATSTLGEADRRCVAVVHDWFNDPAFAAADDSVVLIAEARSLLNQRLARLPQILEVAAPSPDQEVREHFIAWFQRAHAGEGRLKLWSGEAELARLTAGLSIHAIAQLLKGAAHGDEKLAAADVVAKVEEFIRAQLGEETVAFHKPAHTLDDVVGFSRLKAFLREDLMPRLQAPADEALAGAAVCGPIGGGKTFIFEAVASELDMVVLELRNIRSQWFGQTDVQLERLRRVLEALAKVLIFVDEADTQFGGIDPQTHETERRLTGKIQAMMSDPRLRGRASWLLMTARIQNLSPDIRRPGRVGDLIIPVLDPEGTDRREFLVWMATPALDRAPTDAEITQLEALTTGWPAASFAGVRSEMKARRRRAAAPLTLAEMLETLADHLPGDIDATRRYQTLQALVNCSRRRLLPRPDVTEADRTEWLAEIRRLEAMGIR